MNAQATLIAFSHLRWDFVYQRPQQLLTRLARHRPVVYVEEPIGDATVPWLEETVVAPGVTVLRVHDDVAAPGFHDDHLPALRRLLAPVLQDHDDAIAWLYTPMALPLLADLSPSTIVYDCMDELTAFRHAPRQLAQREHALLQRADLVFTGGPSLHRAKQALHSGVHCFPSSVDVAHFAPVAGRPDHDAQRELPHPRLGFFGVIDERFDGALVAALADAEPTWQVVLVGPIVKVDADALPRRPNIHYLGLRAYDELPSLVAGWDACLLPFARNDSTRFISPTKVLEYMAAEQPIISTGIRDVVEPYASGPDATVAIADDAAGFVEACRAALAESPADADARRRTMRETVSRTSWDATADAMSALVDGVRADRPATDDVAVASSTGAQALGQATAPRNVRCAVIGAGPTGLSAAYHQKDAIVFERGDRIGGWCQSIQEGGFTFDCAGHIMFSKDPVVHELYRVLLGDNVHWQNREAWIYSHDVYTRYPFQGALYGLPPAVLKECLVGAIEARFGSLDASSRTPDKPVQPPVACAVKATDADVERVADDCCGDGELARPDAITSSVVSIGAPRNFDDFIQRTWGAGVGKHFAVPYNRKLWTVPLDQIETSWLGGRVPLPDLAEMIEGAVAPSTPPVGPNAVFGYPLRGGFQALMDGFLPHLEGRVELDADVTAIDLKRHRLTLADGRRYDYEQLISTMPLPKLVALIGPAAPESVRRAAAGLKHVSVRCVNLGVARADISEKHWIYYPGDTVFHRIFLQGNTSPHCNPPGGFGLTCEITHAPTKPLPCDGDALIRRCFDDCVRVGLLRADDTLLVSNQVEMEYAYVIYDHARAANVETIRTWLTRFDVTLAGRYSEWEYYNSDHAFLAGRRAGQEVDVLLGARVESGVA